MVMDGARWKHSSWREVQTWKALFAPPSPEPCAADLMFLILPRRSLLSPPGCVSCMKVVPCCAMACLFGFASSIWRGWDQSGRLAVRAVVCRSGKWACLFFVLLSLISLTQVSKWRSVAYLATLSLCLASIQTPLTSDKSTDFCGVSCQINNSKYSFYERWLFWRNLKKMILLFDTLIVSCVIPCVFICSFKCL